MALVGRTWGSLGGSHRAVRVRIRRPLRVIELVTGAMLLTIAAGGMAGPVAAAMLIYRSGAGRDGTAVTVSLVLAIGAVALVLVSAAALFAMAWRRIHLRRPAPGPSSVVADVWFPTPAGKRLRLPAPGVAVGGAR
ncbi:hypothetical protein [Nocardia sp. MW-W600-9]